MKTIFSTWLRDLYYTKMLKRPNKSWELIEIEIVSPGDWVMKWSENRRTKFKHSKSYSKSLKNTVSNFCVSHTLKNQWIVKATTRYHRDENSSDPLSSFVIVRAVKKWFIFSSNQWIPTSDAKCPLLFFLIFKVTWFISIIKLTLANVSFLWSSKLWNIKKKVSHDNFLNSFFHGHFSSSIWRQVGGIIKFEGDPGGPTGMLEMIRHQISFDCLKNQLRSRVDFVLAIFLV